MRRDAMLCRSSATLSDVTTARPRQNGVTIVMTVILLVALLAITAISVEVARLTTTATEVQVAADSGALGAALAISRGQNGQAISAGKSSAGSNWADGHAVDESGVSIDIGHYDSDPAAATHFDTTCTPGTTCNAARATVTVNNVAYVMPTILNNATQTDVEKNAVAAALCQGSAYPLPLAVCDDALREIDGDNLCGPLGGAFTMNPNAADNSCWTSLGASSASASYESGIFPTQCGGTPVEAFQGENINLQNGVANSVWKDLQCCIACQNVHDFVVPVVDCSAMGSCNTAPPIRGFATIHIANAAAVDPPGNGNTQCSNCGVTINNTSAVGITASQICNSALRGRPGGPTCTNFGNTVAPVLGQLP